MKIIELIPHLKSLNKAEALIKTAIPDVSLDVVEIYMKGEVALDSDIVLFDGDSIPLELKIIVEDIEYENLFPLYMAQEMVEEYVESFDDELSDMEIAKRLLHYRLNDA